MDAWLTSLRQRRDALRERGTAVASQVRARGLDALGKVQSGAIDWQRTLATHRDALASASEPEWFRFVELRIAVLDRSERIVARLVDRARSELARFGALELTATTPAAPRRSKKATASRRLVMPIADYESLSAKQILAELPRLSAGQRKTVLEHERAHKKRKTVLQALERRLPS